MSATFFGALPAEIRSIVWEMAATNDAQERIVECLWEATPYYQKATRRIVTGRRSEKAGIRWKYRLREYSRPLGILFATQESRAEALQHNPNYLQLNQGHKIYFNAERDIIFFDMKDTFFMFKYCDRMINRIGRLNVHGFDQIRKLARPRLLNYRGFRDLITNVRQGPLMPNVQSVRCLALGHRIHFHLQLDQWIHAQCVNIRGTLPEIRQRRKVYDDEYMMGLQSGYVFQTIP
jgi:hypothetical protein